MRNFIFIILAFIIIGGGYWLYQRGGYSPSFAPIPASAPAPTPSPADQTASTHTISMDASGFMTANLTIKAGDTVRFVNNDIRERWPASGVHPTHQLCPGFDALKPMQPGKTY